MTAKMLRVRTKFQPFNNLLHNFQQFLHNSTAVIPSSNELKTQSLSNYLVNSLGFTHQQALITSNKVKNLKITPNSNSVVNFLKKHDFNDAHIQKIVSFYPRILFSKVDKTLIPKFRVLQDLGISGSDLARLVSLNPNFLRRQLSDLIPKISSVLGSDENVMEFLMKNHCYTTPAGLENLVSNVALLENEYGVSKVAIRSAVLQRPGYLMRKTDFFRGVVIKVVEELGIPLNSGMFLYGIYLLSSLSEKNIECKRELFKSFGWTDYHVCELIRRSPFVFMGSEENIRKKLDFAMNELGYKPDFLTSRSALFTCSLEKRIRPRYRVLQVLKDKGLSDYNLYCAIVKSETKFLKSIEPFKEDVPGLLELYQNSKGCPDVDPRS